MFGRFRVQHDEQTGRDIVLNNEGAPIGEMTKLGRAEESVAASQAILADEFKAAIKNRLNATPQAE